MNNLKYLALTLNFFGYNSGNGVEKLKDEISKLYSNDDVYVTLNGRSAIYLFLKSFGLEKGSKVMVQAFTCNAVINPILNAGLEPSYVDIDKDTFNMSYDSFISKVNGEVKVLILQHTFGIYGDRRIVEYCKTNGIYVLEDCAHTLGDINVGNWADASMLSFGLEKMLPTRVGGVLIVNNEELLSNINLLYEKVKPISRVDTFKWMLNPLLWRLIRAVGSNGRLLKKLGVLKSGFGTGESEGLGDYSSLQGLSSVLANMGIDCLSSLQDVLKRRKHVSEKYFSNLNQKYPNSFIRYPYVCKDEVSRNELIQFLESKGFPSSDRWYFPVVFPKSTNLKAMKYEDGMCPNAQDISNRVVNLPTGSAVNDEIAMEIVKYINNNCN